MAYATVIGYADGGAEAYSDGECIVPYDSRATAEEVKAALEADGWGYVPYDEDADWGDGAFQLYCEGFDGEGSLNYVMERGGSMEGLTS